VVFSNEIKIMSFNFPNATKNKWEKIGTTLKLIDDKKGDRRDAAKKIIKEYKPDFVCFQETHRDDIQSFMKNDFIKKNYNSYAPPIDESDGETNAILYSKEYKILDKGIIYLNEKQKKGIKSWDDKHERSATWIYVQSIKDPSQKFYLYNLHLGLTVESRVNALKMIYEKATQVKDSITSFIVGDFNAAPGSKTFNAINSNQFSSIRQLSPELKGPSYTYTGFDNKSAKSPDHIMVIHPDKIKPIKFETIDDKPNNTRPSDHYPIMATVELLL
jgi:endonuclease/exonuclease/phosphatase family metal-dependent hydrolase